MLLLLEYSGHLSVQIYSPPLKKNAYWGRVIIKCFIRFLWFSKLIFIKLHSNLHLFLFSVEFLKSLFCYTYMLWQVMNCNDLDDDQRKVEEPKKIPVIFKKIGLKLNFTKIHAYFRSEYPLFKNINTHTYTVKTILSYMELFSSSSEVKKNVLLYKFSQTPNMHSGVVAVSWAPKI